VKNLIRCAWMAHLAVATVALVAAVPAAAQYYPTRTVKIVVPFAAGGGGDTIGRLIARKLGDQLKQSVIFENKPGASSIATDLVAKSQPDGYTLLRNVPLIVQTVSLFNKLPYDPMVDLTPVALLGTTQVYFAAGTSKAPSGTMKEYVALAKAKPNDYNYASIGPGSTGHLLGFALNEASQLATQHIPYKGAAPATQALLSGEVASAFVDYVTLKSHVEAGTVRLLAVTGTERAPRRQRCRPCRNWATRVSTLAAGSEFLSQPRHPLLSSSVSKRRCKRPWPIQSTSRP